MEFVAGTFVLVLAHRRGVRTGRFVDRPDAQRSRRRSHGVSGRPRRQASLTKALLKEPERLSDVGVARSACWRASGQARAAAAAHDRAVGPESDRRRRDSVLPGRRSAGVRLCRSSTCGLTLLGDSLRAAGALCAVSAYIQFVRNRRMLKFDEQFPEAMDLLARALRAGHALTTGLSHGGGGTAGADRTGVQAALRRAELRAAAAAGAARISPSASRRSTRGSS